MNGVMHRLKICTIVFAINWGIEYLFLLYSLSSPQTKSKSMKKYRLWTTASTSCELMAITYNSFSTLHMQTMIFELLLLGWIRWHSGFNCWSIFSLWTRHVKKLTDFSQNTHFLPNVFHCFILKNLYCTIMLSFRRSGHISKTLLILYNYY